MSRTPDLPDTDPAALLASVGLIVDWIPPMAARRDGPPAAKGTPHADDFARAVALNNARKMQTLFQLLAPVVRRALDEGALPDRTRELAARIRSENREIVALGDDAGAVADRLAEIVRERAAEINREYDELLDRAAADYGA